MRKFSSRSSTANAGWQISIKGTARSKTCKGVTKRSSSYQSRSSGGARKDRPATATPTSRSTVKAWETTSRSGCCSRRTR